jgi:hypothetical protein
MAGLARRKIKSHKNECYCKQEHMKFGNRAAAAVVWPLAGESPIQTLLSLFPQRALSESEFFFLPSL